MKIRKAKKTDLKKVSETFLDEFGKKPYSEKWTRKSALGRIKQYFQNSLILILEEQGEIIGFLIGSTYLGWNGWMGFINEFVVSERHQGKGHGKKLMSYFQKTLKKKKITQISLTSHIDSQAFKMYQKWGFKIDKESVSMHKKLR
ncbi:GNAT family N-acetyltransferase [Candidatus Woesearchaeota archaeon]|nr:GNAT family N-acetyltransferase [Candidatus Woesearchaeota archaeon]